MKYTKRKRIRRKKKTRKQRGGRILGKGVIGCASTPPVPCGVLDKDENGETIFRAIRIEDPSFTVSKIILRDDSEREIQGLREIQRIDPREEFTRNKFQVCQNININDDVRECHSVLSKRNDFYGKAATINDLMAILMPYQGKNLDNFTQEDRQSLIQNPRLFSQLLRRPAIGILRLHQQGLAHNDLHIGNILTIFHRNENAPDAGAGAGAGPAAAAEAGDEISIESNIIDFGRMINVRDVNSAYPIGFFYLYPFEYSLTTSEYFQYIFKDIELELVDPENQKRGYKLPEMDFGPFRRQIMKNVNMLFRAYLEKVNGHPFFKNIVPTYNRRVINILFIVSFLSVLYEKGTRELNEIRELLFTTISPIVDYYAFGIFVKSLLVDCYGLDIARQRSRQERIDKFGHIPAFLITLSESIFNNYKQYATELRNRNRISDNFLGYEKIVELIARIDA